MTHPCSFITTDNNGGPDIYDDIMFLNDSGYFPSTNKHHQHRQRRRFNVINMYKKKLSLTSKEVPMPFSLMSAATATARSMMMAFDDAHDNTTVTTASESSASSTSLPSLCLERDLSLSSIQAEHHPAVFDSLVDAEQPPMMEDDDENDDDDDDDEADLMGFCDSFFSEKSNATAPRITSSSSLPFSAVASDRFLNDKNITETKKQNNSKTSKKKVAPVKKKEQQVKRKKPNGKAATSTKRNRKSSTKKSMKDSSMNNTNDNAFSSTANNNNNTKFRPYQAEKWRERYEDLLQFRKEHGHCLVPHTYPANSILARWVKRQRYQYKLFQMKEQSSMTLERIQLLANVGFVWHSHEIVWQERLNELLIFKRQFGHCLVPSNFPFNPKLATWVKCQRRQYKLYLRGSATNITDARIEILENHGFEWQLRSSSHSIEQEIAAHQKKLRLMKMKEDETIKIKEEEMDDTASIVSSKSSSSSSNTAITTAENPTATSMTEDQNQNESSSSTSNEDVTNDDTGNSNSSMDFDYFMNFMEDEEDHDFPSPPDFSEESGDFTDFL